MNTHFIQNTNYTYKYMQKRNVGKVVESEIQQLLLSNDHKFPQFGQKLYIKEKCPFVRGTLSSGLPLIKKNLHL